MDQKARREAVSDIKRKEELRIVVFDNVNFHNKVGDERKLGQTESWNFTSSLAVKVAKLPPPEIMAKGE